MAHAKASWSLASISDLFRALHAVKIGGAQSLPANARMGRSQLTRFFGLMSMLLENGLSLQNALYAMERDKAFRKDIQVLQKIRCSVQTGQTLSSALAEFPKVFDPLMIKQIRIAERSGTLVQAFRLIADALQRRQELRRRVLKKLSYPALVLLSGTGLFVFVMMSVVPQFQEMYEDAQVPLPTITLFVANISDALYRYGLLLLAASVAALAAFVRIRKVRSVAKFMDKTLVQLPVIGGWYKDFSILQFIEAVNTLSQAGFVPADAIAESVDSVSNLAIRDVVSEISTSIRTGNRLSAELAKHRDVFSEAVSQLVVVGEQTGNLSEATRSVGVVLRQQIESRIDAAMGAMEPVITLLLASSIGTLVLAIYTPMFQMFEVLE